jgi:hypothetical protein
MKTVKLLSLMLLVAVMAPLSGGCGVGTTKQDTNRKISRVTYYDSHEMVDDLALLFQTNRPLRTSRWVID